MVTVKDIARVTGLSVSAVSQVLGSRRHLFRKETQEQVLRVAAELGYRPNGAAQAMRRGRFGAVAVISPALHPGSTVPGDGVFILQRDLRERDTHLVMEHVRDDDLTSPDGLPRLFRALSVDGIFVSRSWALPPSLAEVLSRSRIPAIWLNSKMHSDCVYPDDFGETKSATERLLAMGHRKIVLLRPAYGAVPGPQHHYSEVDRPAGYAAAMEAAGLAPWIERISTTDGEALQSLLRRPDRPTAILTDDGADVPGILMHAARLGVRIPQDLSLLSIARDPVVIGGVAVNSLRLPFNKMALRAVPMLFERIAGLVDHQPACPLPYEYSSGDTCAPLSVT